MVKDRYFSDLKSILLNDSSSSRLRYPPEVITLAWNSTANKIACSKTDGSIRIWKLNSSDFGSQYPVIIDRPHTLQVESLSWRPSNDSTLATVGNDKYVKVWHAIKGETLKTIETEEEELFIVKYSGDSKYIATVSKKNVILIINADTGKIVTSQKLDLDICSITWNNTSSFLFVGLSNGTIPLYSFQDDVLSLKYTLSGHKSSIRCLRLEPKARYLVVGSNEGVVSVWSLDDFTVAKIIAHVDEPIHSVDVSRDGTYLLVTFEDGTPGKVYEIDSGEEYHEVPKCVAGSQTFPELQFSPIRTTFAYSTRDGDVYVTVKTK